MERRNLPLNGDQIEMMCNFCHEIIGDLADVGGYVRHLIKQHWDILQRLHDEKDSWS